MNTATGRLAKLEISLALFVSVFKGEGVRTFRVIKNALPDDAELQWTEISRDGRSAYAVIKSESFVPIVGEDIPELPPPFCEAVE